MLKDFGVKGVKVQEVFGLDDELLAMLPYVLPTLFFTSTKNYEEAGLWSDLPFPLPHLRREQARSKLSRPRMVRQPNPRLRLCHRITAQHRQQHRRRRYRRPTAGVQGFHKGLHTRLTWRSDWNFSVREADTQLFRKVSRGTGQS